ncbi:MAG: hypothetical protein EAZ45_20685 [Oscillatoriales cyanobacterium]|nr:MAG: hypothetical protein EAZ45_20685 [Oscillatoriales cyanobacterium]
MQISRSKVSRCSRNNPCSRSIYPDRANIISSIESYRRQGINWLCGRASNINCPGLNLLARRNPNLFGSGEITSGDISGSAVKINPNSLQIPGI